MDLPVGKKQRKEFWKAHVEACAIYSGSISSYCKEHGLGKSQLTYYRQKFSEKKSKFAEVKSVEVSSPMPPLLAPRESIANQQKLPDPKWLAALIRELAR